MDIVHDAGLLLHKQSGQRGSFPSHDPNMLNICPSLIAGSTGPPKVKSDAYSATMQSSILGPAPEPRNMYVLQEMFAHED